MNAIDSPRSDVPVLEGIQYLRGIAAMMVVFHHARLDFSAASAFVAGSRGVEIFFVISGLVMMLSTKGANLAAGLPVGERLAQAFLFWKRRIKRVVPLYWIALPLAAMFVTKTGLRDWGLLQDFLFIPHQSAYYRGNIWPILVPGWTLNYEMFFYLIFGLSFLIGRRCAWLTCACILGLCLLNRLIDSSQVYFRFYTSPYMLNFVAGMLLYHLVGLLRQYPAHRPARWTLALALISGFLVLAFAPHWAGVFGLPITCALIVTAAILLFDGIRIRPLGILGDASYSIYLFHTLSFLLTREIIAIAHVSAADTSGVLITFCVYLAVAALVGTAIHYVVEKPLIKIATRLLGLERAKRSIAFAKA